MNGAGVLDLELTSDPAELPRIREVVRGWTTTHGWDEDQVAGIVLAVDEALSNVIRHGYEGQPGRPIELRLRPVDDPTHGPGVEIRIRDFGRQVPLDQIRGRDLTDHRPGGLGVHIIHNVMDCVQYAHAPGGGMLLRMRKYQRSTRGAADKPAGGA